MSESDSIGRASMQPDGTVTLRLRVEGPAGAVGEGLLVYRPSDSDYALILEHLDGLRPGEEKPVRPFPDDDDSAA